jgi:hypothetical protein
MDSIWKEWEEHYRRQRIDAKRICKDGIIDPAKFNQTCPRILYVLKDVNNRAEDDPSHGVRNLPEWLQDGPRHQLWFTIAKWSAGLLCDFPLYNTLGKDLVRDSFARVAAINLKKASGGARVDNEIVSAYTHQDRNLLLEQIRRINPQLIISCGVMEQLIWLLDLKVNPESPSDKPVRDEVRGAWVVPFRHPARAAGSKIYEQLKAVVSTVYKNGILN